MRLENYSPHAQDLIRLYQAPYEQKKLTLSFSVHIKSGISDSESRYFEQLALELLFHKCISIVPTLEGKKQEAYVYVPLGKASQSQKRLLSSIRQGTDRNVVISTDTTWRFLECSCSISTVTKVINFNRLT